MQSAYHRLRFDGVESECSIARGSGPWLDNDQWFSPIAPKSYKHSPEEPVSILEMRSLKTTFQDTELMPERERSNSMRYMIYVSVGTARRTTFLKATGRTPYLFAPGDNPGGVFDPDSFHALETGRFGFGDRLLPNIVIRVDESELPRQ